MLSTNVYHNNHPFSGRGEHLIQYLHFVISPVEVGDVPRVEDHVDVLHHSLVLDLVVRKQEHQRLARGPRLHQQTLDVVPPFRLVVRARYCYL